MNTTIDFPDINTAFIGALNLNAVCWNYINILKRSENADYHKYSEKLMEFIKSYKQIIVLLEEFLEIRKFLRNWSKYNSVQLSIRSRKKAFIGFNSKIRLFLSNDYDLNAIRDLLGFKIILFTSKEDNLLSQKLSYKLMNDLLSFFEINRQATLLTAESRLGKPLQKNSKITKKIFVCNQSFLKPEFESKVKNYVRYPKDTGYQGLHAYIKTSAGLVFEVQVKTLAMDIYGESIHKLHKKQRYANFKIPLDYKKINLPGVVFDSHNYLVSDKCGLLTSVNPFNLI